MDLIGEAGMRTGRPWKGSHLVDRLEASGEAKKRARAILDNLGGELSVQEACGELGVGEARFHQLRERFLAEGVKGLEPRPGGRPPKVEPEGEKRMRELGDRVRELETRLKAEELRTQIALVMPHLLKDGPMPIPPCGRGKKR